MIIGTDLMSELGLQLNFHGTCVEWKDTSMPFKDGTQLLKPHSMWKTSDRYKKAIKRILDATYEKADLEKITSECQHLNVEERESLLTRREALPCSCIPNTKNS